MENGQLTMDNEIDTPLQKRRREAEELRERCKLAYLDPNVFLMVLNWCNRPMDMVSLPVTEEIPEGTFIDDIFFEPARRAFVARLCHPSFDRIAPGARPPSFGEWITQLCRRKHGSTELVKVE